MSGAPKRPLSILRGLMLGIADCRTQYRMGVQVEQASPGSCTARWYSPAQAHLLSPADAIKPDGPVVQWSYWSEPQKSPRAPNLLIPQQPQWCKWHCYFQQRANELYLTTLKNNDLERLQLWYLKHKWILNVGFAFSRALGAYQIFFYPLKVNGQTDWSNSFLQAIKTFHYHMEGCMNCSKTLVSNKDVLTFANRDTGVKWDGNGGIKK